MDSLMATYYYSSTHQQCMCAIYKITSYNWLPFGGRNSASVRACGEGLESPQDQSHRGEGPGSLRVKQWRPADYGTVCSWAIGSGLLSLLLIVHLHHRGRLRLRDVK